MNRLYKILLLVLVVALAACNPTQDLKKQIEDQAPAPKANLNYTLTSADYSTIAKALLGNKTHADSVAASKISSNEYLFGSYDHTYIPDILSAMYPALGDKSSAHVSYNYYVGPMAVTVMLEGADQYTLKTADYNAINDSVGSYGTFYPDYPPENYVPDYLKTKFPNAADSTLEFVTYNYADTDPIASPPVLDEEFNGSLGSFTAVDVSGPKSWHAASYQTSEYAYMSGYGSDNEDWLVSSAIDLSGYSHPSFQINQAINYVNGQWDQVQVLVSTDYSGDVSSATWKPLTINTLPTGANWTFVTSEKVDLSAYAKKTIHIAFKYLSTTSNAPAWEIDWVKVYGVATTTVIGKQSVFYRLLNGTWKPEKGVYALSSDDYNSMGAPGSYDNFSSSVKPDNYIPRFLAQKYPYAQEGDQINVGYMYYYSYHTYLYVDHYTFTNSMWTKYNPVASMTTPFVNNGTKWVFDPTVYKTMTISDYQVIVDAVKKTHPNLVNTYGDGEDYYGADAYYGDFNAQIANRAAQDDFAGKTDAEATALIYQRIPEGIIVMLQNEYPNATSQVSGVDQKYVITYNVYPNTGGSNVVYTSTFQCTKSGPDPQFKLISAPIQPK